MDEDTRQHAIPGLILQPLVENAVRHGLAPLAAGGTVHIAAGIEDDKLIIEVQDDGVGMQETSTPDGHGLSNVRQRLQRFYDGQADLSIAPGSDNRGTRIRLSLPRTAT